MQLLDRQVWTCKTFFSFFSSTRTIFSHSRLEQFTKNIVKLFFSYYWWEIFDFFMLFCFVYHHYKLVLKSVNFERTFWCLKFFQKTNLKISISALLGKKFFVRFLEELKNPKFVYDINWPLKNLLDLKSCDFKSQKYGYSSRLWQSLVSILNLWLNFYGHAVARHEQKRL